MIAYAWLLTAGASGCSSAPLGSDPGPQDASLQALSCAVVVATATLHCVDATPGVRAMAAGPVTLGGQGVNVLLASSGVGYTPGIQIFTASVTLKNLTAEPLGTSNGTSADPSGIRVFFHSGPNTTGGTGPVTVANADGSGNFTGTDQPYFQYPGNLAGGATTAAKVWNFLVPSSATTFQFQVYVQAQVPQPSGVLRWLRDSLGPTGTFYNAWGTSATDVYSVGVFNTEELLSGRLIHWNGSGWSTVTNFADLTYGVWVGGNTILAAGPLGIVQWSADLGAHWTRTAIAGEPLLGSVWGGGENDLYVTGSGGKVLHSTNGTIWTPMTTGASQYLNQVWGRTPADVYAVGYGGTIIHYDGVSWSSLPPPAASATTIFYGIAGVIGGDLVAVGAGGTILRRGPAASNWTPEASGTTVTLRAVWCGSGSDCTAIGDQGTMLRWNGTLWSPMTSGVTTTLRGIWGGSTTQTFAVGDSGVALRGVR